MRQRIIGVIGAGEAEDEILALAEEVGRSVAEAGCILVCGGLGGVMEAACKGAKAGGGTTVGILPGSDRHGTNPYVDIPVVTGFGEGRNVFIVRSADVLIAVAGEYGTLSEIAFALKSGKTVVGLATWDIPGVLAAATAEEAVRLAVDLIPPL